MMMVQKFFAFFYKYKDTQLVNTKHSARKGWSSYSGYGNGYYSSGTRYGSSRVGNTVTHTNFREEPVACDQTGCDNRVWANDETSCYTCRNAFKAMRKCLRCQTEKYYLYDIKSTVMKKCVTGYCWDCKRHLDMKRLENKKEDKDNSGLIDYGLTCNVCKTEVDRKRNGMCEECYKQSKIVMEEEAREVVRYI